MTPLAAAGERWYTVTEAAVLLHRSRKTLLNLMYEHHVPRKLIRQGRHPRRIIVFSEVSLTLLRQHTRT